MRGRGLRPGGRRGPADGSQGQVSIPLMRGRGLRPGGSCVSSEALTRGRLNPPDAGTGSATTAVLETSTPRVLEVVSIPLMRGRGLRRQRAPHQGGDAAGVSIPLMRGRGLRRRPAGQPAGSPDRGVSIPLMRGRGLRQDLRGQPNLAGGGAGLNPPDAGTGSATTGVPRLTTGSTWSLNPPDAGTGSATDRPQGRQRSGGPGVSIPLMRGRGLRLAAEEALPRIAQALSQSP